MPRYTSHTASLVRSSWLHNCVHRNHACEVHAHLTIAFTVAHMARGGPVCSWNRVLMSSRGWMHTPSMMPAAAPAANTVASDMAAAVARCKESGAQPAVYLTHIAHVSPAYERCCTDIIVASSTASATSVLVVVQSGVMKPRCPPLTHAKA